MDEESMAVALDYAPRQLQIIWTTTALTRAEESFRQKLKGDWEEIIEHAEDVEMIVEYRAQGTDVGPNGYQTNYELSGHIDHNVLEQDNVDITERTVSHFADTWARKIVEVIGETQAETTLSEKEFAGFVTMKNESCSEPEAADALGITVGTYRGKKGRIKSKREACSNTDIFSRLLDQPDPPHSGFARDIGRTQGRINATRPSDIYRAQLDAGERSLLKFPRESPVSRRHETYEQGHWRTAHVQDVDNLYVADTVSDGYEEGVRLDFDGVGHGGADMHEEGENIQISVWYTEEQAREIQEKLAEKFDS